MPRPSTLLTTLYGLALSSWAGMLLAQDTQRADWQTHGQPASGDILLIDEHFRTVRLETPSSGDWESTTKTPGPLLLPPLPESAAPISPSKAEAEPLQTSASPVPAPMLLPPLPQEARMTPRPISEPIPPSKRRPTPQSLPAPEPLSPIQQVAAKLPSLESLLEKQGAESRSPDQDAVQRASVEMVLEPPPLSRSIPSRSDWESPPTPESAPVRTVYDFGITPPAPLPSSSVQRTISSNVAASPFERISQSEVVSADAAPPHPSPTTDVPPHWAGDQSYYGDRMTHEPFQTEPQFEDFHNNRFNIAAQPFDGLACDDLPCDGFFPDGDSYRHPRRPRERGIFGTYRDGRLVPWASLGVRGADQRTMGEVDFLYPLWQDVNSVFFANLRGQFDDMGGSEGNFGLGYRVFIKPTAILGTYAFYNALGSSEGNTFHQGTIGLELLTLNWDFRVNGYFRESSPAYSPNVFNVSNGTIITRDFEERAYAGIDAEIGRRILFWGWNDRYQLHWFVGGYYFGHEDMGNDSFGGPKSRLEFRIHDLGFLGEQSRLELGVESSYDDVRDDQFAAFLRLRIPFGWRENRERLDPMRRRLMDRVYHDVE